MAFSGAVALEGAELFGGAELAGDAALGALGFGADVAVPAAALSSEALGGAAAAGGAAAGFDALGFGADVAAPAAGIAGLGDLSSLAGLGDVAGSAGAGAGGAVSTAAPALALPGSALPESAGLSAVSAASPFAAAPGAAADPLTAAGWGATGMGDSFPTLAAQSAGVNPVAPTGGADFIGSAGGGGAGSGGAATATGASPDALTAITSQPAVSGAAPGAAPGVTPPAAPPPGIAPPPSGVGASGGIMDWIKANPVMAASLGIGGGLLAKNALSPQKLPNQDKLDALAKQAEAMSAQNSDLSKRLLDPLATGKLPAPQEAQVQQALQDSITAIKSKYASLGMSGSTVEQDDIQAANQKALVLSGTLAEQMAQTGLSAGSQAASSLQISGTIYETIMQQQIQQDNALQQAIAAFAGQAAMAGAISTSGNRKVA